VKKPFEKRSIIFFIVILALAGNLTWQYLYNQIQQITLNKLSEGLYKAVVHTEFNAKRVYNPQRRYYYVNISDPLNVAMVKQYLSNYIKSHDSLVVLKNVDFREPDSNNLDVFATVAVPVISAFPRITTNVELNAGMSLSHFKHPIA